MLLCQFLAVQIRFCLYLLVGFFLQQDVLVFLFIERQIRKRHADRLRANVIELDTPHANLVFEYQLRQALVSVLSVIVLIKYL